MRNTVHFTLAATRCIRNLSIMRKLLLTMALTSLLISSAQSAKSQTLKTNTLSLGKHGTLEVLTPNDWGFVRTNVSLPGNPPTFEFQSPGKATVLRMSVYWDGFAGKTNNPAQADFQNIVSNVCVIKYVPASVEKKVVLEKLEGPAVSGVFARFTDADWVPMLKDEYRVLATGMFRSGNLWGDFDMVTGDKDGPLFRQGLEVLRSMRRQP